MFKLLIFEVRYSIEARYSIPHSSMNPIHEFRPFQNMAVISLKSVSAQQSGAAAPIVQFIPSAAWAIAGNPACAAMRACETLFWRSFTFYAETQCTNVRITLQDGNQLVKLLIFIFVMFFSDPSGGQRRRVRLSFKSISWQPRQACSSQNQIVIWIWFWFSIWQTRPIYK